MARCLVGNNQPQSMVMPTTVFIITRVMLLIHWLILGGHTSRLLLFSHSISFHQTPKRQINNPQHLFLVRLPREVLSEEVAWSGTGEWVPSALPPCRSAGRSGPG